jgi:hypothetical protein
LEGNYESISICHERIVVKRRCSLEKIVTSFLWLLMFCSLYGMRVGCRTRVKKYTTDPCCVSGPYVLTGA